MNTDGVIGGPAPRLRLVGVLRPIDINPIQRAFKQRSKLNGGLRSQREIVDIQYQEMKH